VVLAAEDGVVVLRMAIDAQVVIRIGGVPVARFGNGAGWQAGTDDIARIGIDFRLKKRGAHNACFAHQRHMRGDDDVVAAHLLAVDLGGVWLCFEFGGFRVFVNR
jgi:hypothetical protein